MTRHTRRTVLGTLGATLSAVAGCNTLDDGSPSETDTGSVVDNQSQTATPTDTGTDDGDDETQALQQRVAELQSELEDTRTELEETEAALETARQTATEATEQLVYDKYVYAWSLCDSADQLFEQANNQWENEEFEGILKSANQAVGLYMAGQEAAKEAAQQATESSTDWSGTPADEANTLAKYAREMEAASSAFTEAAKTAREAHVEEASETRETVAESVSSANDLIILSVSGFEEEL